MSSCLICRSDQSATILDLGRQPVASHFMTSPGQPATEHPLALSVCRSCGVIQLAETFPFADLTPPYDWITYREPESHLDSVAETICRLPGLRKGGTAAGLSFKDATTLDRLDALGFANCWSLDPHHDLGADNPNANIESVPGLLTPQRAARISHQRGPADVVVARHILEHAEKPWRFLQALGEMVAPGGYLVIEVPDCRANLERQDYSMIWEEHTLYFTPDTVAQVLSATGCTLVDIEIHPFPFEDVILVYARKGPEENSAASAVEASVIEQNVSIAHNYGRSFRDWSDKYDAALRKLTKEGRKLAAYGAGHLTCAFINFHGLAEHFAFVVDDTPQKQGLLLPGCGLPIVPHERLTTREISACLFGLDPQIEEKVIANNPGFHDAGGRFFSMFADSTRSIRTACDA